MEKAPKSLLELRRDFKQGSDFFAAYDAEARALQVVVGADPVASNLTEGELVAMTLRFVERDAEFSLHARVVERKDQHLKVAFLEEEADRLELVLTCAEGESLPYFTRRFERIPSALPARLLTVEDGRELLRARTRVISEGGASVQADEDTLAAIEVGQRLMIGLTLDDHGDELLLNCRVVSVISSPPRPGFGIEFLFTSSAQRDSLAAAVAAIRERG